KRPPSSMGGGIMANIRSGRPDVKKRSVRLSARSVADRRFTRAEGLSLYADLPGHLFHFVQKQFHLPCPARNSSRERIRWFAATSSSTIAIAVLGPNGILLQPRDFTDLIQRG